MSKTKTPTLEEAVEAVRKLPEPDRTVAVQEILAMTEEGVLPPVRSPEDQAIIEARVKEPFKEAPRAEIDQLLNRFKPAV